MRTARHVGPLPLPRTPPATHAPVMHVPPCGQTSFAGGKHSASPLFIQFSLRKTWNFGSSGVTRLNFKFKAAPGVIDLNQMLSSN